MAGRSSFDFATRKLRIDYEIHNDSGFWFAVDHNKDKWRRLKQQIFEHDSRSLIKWKVYFRFNNTDDIRLCIEPVDAAVNKIFKYSLSVTMNGKKKNYGVNVYNGTEFECQFPSFVVYQIQIKIVYPFEAINQMILLSAPKSKILLPKMMTNTSSKDQFADVEFIVEDKVIVGHKVILSDRSEVFNKMFTFNVAANNTKSIPIVDASYDGFNHFMDAIYFGITPTDLAICLEVATLAEKYDIQDIKTAIEASIIASINMENAIKILIHGYLNNMDRVKKLALEFCAKSPMHEMNGSKELAAFPDLLNEVFKQISLTKGL